MKIRVIESRAFGAVREHCLTSASSLRSVSLDEALELAERWGSSPAKPY